MFSMLFHQYSWHSEVEKTWISLIGWHHKTSRVHSFIMRWNQFWRKITWSGIDIPPWIPVPNMYTYFPQCKHFSFWKKMHSTKIMLVPSGTVLMIQLTQNSPTCAYIGKNLHKWKPCFAGTRCTNLSKQCLNSALQTPRSYVWERSKDDVHIYISREC